MPSLSLVYGLRLKAMVFLLFLLYLTILMAVGYAISQLLGPLFGRGWRLFVAPGVIAHELAHVLACVLVGAPVHEVNFWKASGGHVVHGPPRLHLIGPFLISLAPMILMTAGLFVLSPLISTGLTEIEWTQVPPATLSEATVGYLAAVGIGLTQFSWTNWSPYLLMYGMLNVAVTIAPSRIDLANAKWALLALFLIISLGHWFLSFNLSLDVVWPPIATSLVLLGMALVAAVLIRLSVSFFKYLRRPN